MMIRYATFILPPVADKDDHIIPCLAAVLREAPRLDIKIRRRALAALGEVVFYVSAQGDEASAKERGREVDSWRLPSSAIAVIVRCLREDPDETIRHYAAKLVENVMAQGSVEYKQKLGDSTHSDITCPCVYLNSFHLLHPLIRRC